MADGFQHSRTAMRQTHLKNLEHLLEQAAHHGETGNGSTSVQHTNSSIKALEDIRAEVIAMLALQPQGHGHNQDQDYAASGEFRVLPIRIVEICCHL